MSCSRPSLKPRADALGNRYDSKVHFVRASIWEHAHYFEDGDPHQASSSGRQDIRPIELVLDQPSRCQCLSRDGLLFQTHIVIVHFYVLLNCPSPWSWYYALQIISLDLYWCTNAACIFNKCFLQPHLHGLCTAKASACVSIIRLWAAWVLCPQYYSLLVQILFKVMGMEGSFTWLFETLVCPAEFPTPHL